MWDIIAQLMTCPWFASFQLLPKAMKLHYSCLSSDYHRSPEEKKYVNQVCMMKTTKKIETKPVNIGNQITKLIHCIRKIQVFSKFIHTIFMLLPCTICELCKSQYLERICKIANTIISLAIFNLNTRSTEINAYIITNFDTWFTKYYSQIQPDTV